jgi:hypothetical protein
MKTRIAMLCLLSAGTSASTTTQHATFRGRWFIAPTFEPVFTLCGDHDKWLLELDSSLTARFEDAKAETTLVYVSGSKDTAVLDSATASLLPPPIFVVVQGDTSPRGAYGRNGSFSHRLLVHQVDSIPMTERAKCS